MVMNQLTPLVFIAGSGVLLAGCLGRAEVPFPFVVGNALYLLACFILTIRFGPSLATCCFIIANGVGLVLNLCAAGLVPGLPCPATWKGGDAIGMLHAPTVPPLFLFLGSLIMTLKGPGITPLAFLGGSSAMFAGEACDESKARELFVMLKSAMEGNTFPEKACTQVNTLLAGHTGVIACSLFLVGSVWMLISSFAAAPEKTKANSGKKKKKQ